MENILLYSSVGLFYILTNPSPMLSRFLFRMATISRFVHTSVYAIYVVPQPARMISFFIQYIITIYTALQCIIYLVSRFSLIK